MPILKTHFKPNLIQVLKKISPWGGSITIAIMFWCLFSYGIKVDKTLLATPIEVLERFLKAFDFNTPKDVQIFTHAFYTMERALLGWGIAVLIGGLIGIALGRLTFIFKIVEPLIEFIRATPPILIFPLFLVAFNYGQASYIGTITFSCIPVMVITVVKGIYDINHEKYEILRLHTISQNIKIYILGREALPAIILGSRLTLSFAIVIAIVTEMVFTPRSGWALGALARDAEINFDTPTFYACILLIGVISYGLNAVIKRLEQ